MALIVPCREFNPEFGENCFLAENATIIGDVIMGNDCSVWFQAVVRGDVNFIRIGDKVNIQDGAIIHGTYQKCGTAIGDNVSIGHRALVHGCTLHDNVLVGMGAIIMDQVVVEENCLIAAGAVVVVVGNSSISIAASSSLLVDDDEVSVDASGTSSGLASTMSRTLGAMYATLRKRPVAVASSAAVNWIGAPSASASSSACAVQVAVAESQS